MTFDVIVVGSGPGGSVAAMTLARSGKSVLLVDRQLFPRDKVCGDGLPAEVMVLLRQLGVDLHTSRAHFQRINSISISSPSGRLLQTSEGKRDVFAMTWPRESFDYMLHQHALRNGARFEQMNVHGPLMSADRRRVVGIVERRGQNFIEHEAKVVISAGGVAAPIARVLRKPEQNDQQSHAVAIRAYVCLNKPLAPDVQFFFLPDLLPGYAWSFPLADNRANVGVYLHAETYQERKTNLRDVLNEFLAILRRSHEFEVDSQSVKSWSLPLFVSPESRAMPGVLLVGDEGRFVNALTGGGIYSAMATGEQAARQAVHILESRPSLMSYDRAWRQQVWMDLRRGRFVQQHIASRPRLFDGIFALCANPILRTPFLRAIAGDHY